MVVIIQLMDIVVAVVVVIGLHLVGPIGNIVNAKLNNAQADGCQNIGF